MRFLSKTAATRAALIAGLSSACLIAGANSMVASPVPPGPARDQAASLQREEAPLSANAEAAAYARHVKTRDQLQLPVGKTHRSVHVRDGFLNAEYDEVSEIDATGHPASLTQFDPDGRMRAAFRFDRPKFSTQKTDAAGAAGIAGRSIRSLGLVPPDAGSVDADEATNGWTVRWARKAAGYAVRGDDTTVVVRPDGQIQSVSRVEHQLAPAPGRIIAVSDATSVVKANGDRWFAASGSGCAVEGLELQWVDPNNALGSAKLDSAAKPYRLAWVGTLKPTGRAATYVTLISVFVDAADGTIIGGDVVE